MRNIRFLILWSVLFVMLISGCASVAEAQDSSIQETNTQEPVTHTPIPTLSDTPTATASQATLPTDTPTAEPSSTPSPTIPGPPSSNHLIPDSELVFSASAADFDTAAYLEQAGGFLGTYRQYLMITAWTDAPAIIDMVAIENTINPRLLVALLEYQCGCVLGMGIVEEPDEFASAMGASGL